MLQGLLGVNWKTTLAGLTAIIAVLGKIAYDFKTKDFVQVATDLQTLIPELTAVAIGVGLIHAKDGNTTGVGDTAQKG